MAVDAMPDAAESGKRLLVVIPALNEEATVGHVIRRVPLDIAGIAETLVVVVDDGSTDRTSEVSREAGARVVRHPEPQGVGSVFHRALDLVVEEAADVLVFIDADGQFNPRDIAKLVPPILDGRADCVTASRYHPDSPPMRQSLGRRLGNRGVARLVSILVGQRLYDVACGFRAYSAETAMHLNLTGRFTYTQEALLDISFKDGRVLEVPVRVRGTRKHGRSRVASSLFAYGRRAFMIMLRAYRDYRPLKFFGLSALVLFCLGAALSIFFFAHYIRTGRFSPHLWAGISAGFFFIMSAVSGLAGILADMLDRIRLNQEQMLYHQKRARHAARRAEIRRSAVGHQQSAGDAGG